MNKKGFTLVELITTFALTAVIIIMLINIVLIIKNLYIKYDVKTQLLINQADLSKSLNSVISDKNIISYEECEGEDTISCYSFSLSDGDDINLIVKESTIRFGNYVYKEIEGTEIGEVVIKEDFLVLEDGSVNNSFLIINIPITNKLYPNEDFGVNIVYTYNSNELNLEG